MFRIATFNLENLDDGPGVEPPLSVRIAALRPQLTALKADILCLQEINAQKPAPKASRVLSALEALLEHTPYAGYHRAATERPLGEGYIDKHNLVTLSRFPIERHAQHRHDRVTPPMFRPSTADPIAKAPLPVEWDRSILHAVIRIPGPKPLHVFNLHLRAPLAAAVEGQKASAFVWKSVSGWAEGYYIAALKRAGQALEARLLIEDIFDEDPLALVAVCGDFNAEDYEVPVRLLCADEEDTGNGPLAGRALFPVDRELARARRYSVIHHGRPQMLDHLFASAALHSRIEAVEVDNADLGDEFLDFVEGQETGKSHHAPLVATVRGAEDDAP